MAVWTDFNFKKQCPIANKELEWADTLNGQTLRARQNARIGLIFLTTLVILLTIVTIIGLAYNPNTLALNSTINILDWSNFSNIGVIFIPPVLMIGICFTAVLINFIKIYNKLIDNHHELSKPIEKNELNSLFNKGTLDQLKQFIYEKKLDLLVFQRLVTIEQAKEMLRIVCAANDPDGFNNRTQYAEIEWAQLRNAIYTSIASPPTYTPSNQTVIYYTTVPYESVQ